MVHASRHAPGTILYAFLCAAVLLGCCCGLLVVICGPPVWARETRGWTAPDGTVTDPEPPGGPAGAPGEPEFAAAPDGDPDPDPDPPEAPVSRPRREASSSIRALGEGEIPAGARERLRARIAGGD